MTPVVSRCHLRFTLADTENQVWTATAESGRVYEIQPTLLVQRRGWCIAVDKRMLIRPRFDKFSEAIQFCQDHEVSLLAPQPVAA